MDFTATIWALLPPIIAIVLALLTKEVYISLMIGIFSGAMLICGFNPLTATGKTFEVMGAQFGEYNVNIIIFLVFLGMIVALTSKSGATDAYGRWATKAIKSKRGALFSTSALGALIFVDDYFNCLTVGAVMKPVTDRYKVSRAKLAYIIDATAAPICIMMPISSWGAAVSGSLPEESGINGFKLFIDTIPFNLYAILTLVMIVVITLWGVDFFKMRKVEQKMLAEDKAGQAPVEKADLVHDEDSYTAGTAFDEKLESGPAKKGKIIDLILPIVMLIIFCIMGMLYTGGILEGASIIDAFNNCDAPKGLVMGSFVTIILTALLYLPRKVVTFTEFANSITEGFKAMVPAITILTLAWTLKGICDVLEVNTYVSGIVKSASGIIWLLPTLFFLVAIFLAFSTGTSWGTFGIMIPIAVAAFGSPDVYNMLVITVAATLAGAVCGDHISPISDTTILASAGADCNHIEHVSTQIPYAIVVCIASTIGFIVSGLTGNGFIGLAVGLVVLLGILFVLKLIYADKEAEA